MISNVFPNAVAPYSWYAVVQRNQVVERPSEWRMGHTTQLQKWLTLANQGDPAAREAVIEHACERLRQCCRKMLRNYSRVRRWAETDDVLQNALLRLHRSLAQVQPESARQFYGLAATQIRRELLDLTKHFFGAEGLGKTHESDRNDRCHAEEEKREAEPTTLAAWTAFHEAVATLPEEQQEVVHLLWYDGMPQPEAAKLLSISLATLKRRWQAARLALCHTLDEQDFI